MTALRVKQVLASIVFGVALILALLLALMLLAAAANFGFAGLREPIATAWLLVICANPFVGAFIRAKYQATFDQPGNRALLGVAVLSVVLIHVGMTLWFMA